MKDTNHIRIFVVVVCVTVSFFPLFSMASDSNICKTDSCRDEWLRGIFRVNTDVSAGDESLSTVCEKGEEADLDFIVVSDQFVVRAEYGLWPLNRTISYAVKRDSVVEFGVERYLSLIETEDESRENLVLIPGVDVAPHYYWRGFPFTKEFGTRRFSEQLTIFGSSKARFYHNLPVIHNEISEFSLYSILKMLPLLITAWGIFLLFHLRGNEYRDSSGKLLSSEFKRSRLILALLLILLGLVWTFENRPFTRDLEFDQYADFGNIPYQKLIDYVNVKGEKNSGVIWSAPEATMRSEALGAVLVSKPYLSDVQTTYGHNGMAGLYGDAITALRAGGEWDAMLMEYCAGKRRVRPIIVGELDYHGRKRRIDMYQTVVRGAKKSRASIFNAIIEGRSYAYAKPANCGIELIDAYLSDGPGISKLGDTLKLGKNSAKLVANLSFKLTGERDIKWKGEVQIIVNGKLLKKEKFRGSKYHGKFSIDVNSLLKEQKRLGYVRFDISACGGRIVTNPIFIKRIQSASCAQE